MILSLNELEATLLKAARGAGMPWGLAEEAATAGRWLAERRLDVATPFLSLFEALPMPANPVWDGACLKPADPCAWLCPIMAGSFLSDIACDFSVTFERVLCPILMVPFADRAAFADRKAAAIEMVWEGLRLRLDGSDLALVAGKIARLSTIRADRMVIDRAATATDGKAPMSFSPSCTEVEIELDLFARLQAFEALNSVPASERSRVLGAGAGDSDND